MDCSSGTGSSQRSKPRRLGRCPSDELSLACEFGRILGSAERRNQGVGRAVCERFEQHAFAQDRHDALAEPVRLFEVGVTGQDELLESQLVVLRYAIGDFAAAADQRCAGATADETDARPHIGMDLEAAGETPPMLMSSRPPDSR